MYEDREEMIEIDTRDLYWSNTSLVMTVAQSARQVLDIDDNTEVRQYVDPGCNALVIVPVDEDSQED
jgi:hypothetical protein